MRQKRWIGKLALLIFSSVLGLLSVETVVRLTGLDRPLLWEPDPKLGWRHIPNARLHWVEEGDGDVRINSLGFRDGERAIRKDSGVFRIAVFGDSTTEASQVNLEQTFCQLLEKRLETEGRRVEVLNFGVSGYGPLQEYLLYSLRGRQFAPDLVLQAVFLDNDVADGDRRLAAGQRGAPFLKSASGAFEVDDSLAVSSVDDYVRQPLFTVRRLSATYRMLSAARSRRAANAAVQAAREANNDVPRRFLLYADPLAIEWEEAWQTFERVLTEFSDAVRRDGAAFAVLSMPAGQVVDRNVWQALLMEYPAMASRQWDVMSAERRLQRLGERYQIPVIAPLEAFVQAGSTEPLFFNGIGHLTPRGHQVMAAAVQAGLLKLGLLKPPAGQVSGR